MKASHLSDAFDHCLPFLGEHAALLVPGLWPSSLGSRQACTAEVLAEDSLFVESRVGRLCKDSGVMA